MKQKAKTHLNDLIDDRLITLGADCIPAPARDFIRADILDACAALVRHRVTGDYIGKMVARGLAAKEGGEGETPVSPSQSKSPRKRSAQGDVDFPASNSLEAHDGEGEARRLPTQQTGDSK